MNDISPIQKAIKLAGSEAKLGKACGRSQHAIWYAKTKNKVSAELAIAIEAATGGQVTRSDLRPDLYGAA